MSKRKLTWLVDEGTVHGWPQAAHSQGGHQEGAHGEGSQAVHYYAGLQQVSVVFMEWDQIRPFIKKVLDLTVARHTTVDQVYNKTKLLSQTY